MLVEARRRGIEDRWAPIAGAGSLGASYLPCCPARLLGSAQSRVDDVEALARLALLWSERAAALRFRRAVLAMKARAPDEMLELARIRREAFAYDAGASRLRDVRATKRLDLRVCRIADAHVPEIRVEDTFELRVRRWHRPRGGDECIIPASSDRRRRRAEERPVARRIRVREVERDDASIRGVGRELLDERRQPRAAIVTGDAEERARIAAKIDTGLPIAARR